MHSNRLPPPPLLLSELPLSFLCQCTLLYPTFLPSRRLPPFSHRRRRRGCTCSYPPGASPPRPPSAADGRGVPPSRRPLLLSHRRRRRACTCSSRCSVHRFELPVGEAEDQCVCVCVCMCVCVRVCVCTCVRARVLWVRAYVRIRYTRSRIPRTSTCVCVCLCWGGGGSALSRAAPGRRTTQ